jgi:hypothetical protein
MNVADPNVPQRHSRFNGYYKIALRRDGARWKISDILLLEVSTGGEHP